MMARSAPAVRQGMNKVAIQRLVELVRQGGWEDG